MGVPSDSPLHASRDPINCARLAAGSRAPGVIVLIVLSLVFYVVWIIGFFAVLITGRWPEALREFVVGYHLFLYDDYPPFSLR